MCYGLVIEPSLQPVTKEQLTHKSANTEDGPRLDIGLSTSEGGWVMRIF